MNEPIEIRRARREDLPAIVRLLADDPLGGARETAAGPVAPAYETAFAAIEADPDNDLLVATAGPEIVGVFQLVFIPHLVYQGGWRAQIEGVRVAVARRGRGIGTRMMQWAIERARERGCALVQLTSDKSRSDALRFYRRLGFRDSHQGLKLHL